MVYLAGQVSVDADGTLVGKNDAVAQTRQALQNLGHVLSGAGADSSNVVEFTTYVVGRSSIQEYIKGRSEVYPEILSGWKFHPNTLLIVAGLVNEDFLVEIKVVAALP